MSDDTKRAVALLMREVPMEPDLFLGTLIQQDVRRRITEGAKP